jgi:hypothetical protein
MAQDVLGLTKLMVRKIWSALMLVPAPAVQARPQLNGRRGYGDDSIKRPD